MMRIAIAGGGGLGYLLAFQLSQAANAYNVVVLSRTARPEFGQLDVQLHVVDYSDADSLIFALRGVDVAISTVSGDEQLHLINAAGHARVRKFVPSEFEGTLTERPRRPLPDPLDRGSARARHLLDQWERSSRMRYTIFSCGVFMESFHPGGLGFLNIGYGSNVSGAGDYLLDINNCTAEYARYNSAGRTVRLCLTSVSDLVRFIVAALDLGPRSWPREFTMRGDRLSVFEVVETCSRARNALFNHCPRQHDELENLKNFCIQTGDDNRAAFYQRLVATTEGRYDFSRASLNEALIRNRHLDFQPMTLSQWLTNMWQSLYER
ncbi:isoflavone reductase family protein [Moelleriella libera RCEF 2490]|uniref:Isoflavone reductase family protein n=1 Tax=Moelleriella libera RCEF 2490 TaxID=1081109 RepID=A0A166VDU3_9HYPO|nr:isoflavone reductase family protein [Moelleriella libera RCEF 2490]